MKSLFNSRNLFTAVLCIALAMGAVSVASTADREPDQLSHPDCPYCGMDRTKFGHSRVFIVYHDGTAVGTCSLHCAAIDLSLNIDKTPARIKVADYDTKLLIDAETAHWVMGGAKTGVMTRRAKWAFSDENAARAFVSANGGRLAAFSGTIAAAYEDMYEDVRMIRAKRSKMKAERGS